MYDFNQRDDLHEIICENVKTDALNVYEFIDFLRSQQSSIELS